MLLVNAATVARARKRYVEEGLEAAINDRPWPGRERKLDGRQEAHLIAFACSAAPEGHTHWTLQLLADQVVELEFAESISLETVRQILKKTNSSPGRRKSGVSPSWTLRILSVVSGRGCNSVVHGGRGFLDIGVCDRQSKTSDASYEWRLANVITSVASSAFCVKSSQGERGVRGADGGRAGPVPPGVQSGASGSVFRRDLPAIDWGGASAHRGCPRTGGTL